MKKKITFSDISIIIWFGLALLLTLILVSAVSVFIHQKEMTELVAARNILITQGYADISRVLIDQYQYQLDILSLALADETAAGDQMLHVRNDFDGGIFLLNEHCGFAGTAVSGLADPNLMPDELSQICQRLSTDVVLIQDTWLLVQSGAHNSGKLMGLVSLDRFIHNFIKLQTLSDGLIWLVDDDGTILYEGTYDGMPHQVGMMNFSPNNNGYEIVRMPMGELIITSAPIGDLPIQWVYAENWNQASSVLLRITQSVPLALIPAVLIALLLLWFGVNQIVRPLQQLEELADEIGNGNYRNIDVPVGGIKAIRNLQHEMVDLTRKVQQTQKNLHTYIGAITHTQEEERKRVARELHDETLQTMIALNQRLQLLSLEANTPEVHAAIQELLALNNQNMKELRRITGDLRPGYLEDLGLTTSLEMLAQIFRTRAPNCTLNTVFIGPEKELAPKTSLSIYRIAQEALNNVIRHAQAQKVDMILESTNGGITLTIKDNGIGFLVPLQFSNNASEGHYGLLGMYERAELIHATLEIHSEIDKGTQIKVTWNESVE